MYESDFLYTVETPHGTHEDQTEAQVHLRVKMARNDEPIVVRAQVPEQEFDIFYGGSESRVTVGWQGWGQHRTARATNHREAVIKSLYCNHSPGTRFGVVGTESGHPNNGRKTLRHFELQTCSTDEADYRHSGPYSCGPLKVVEVFL